MIRDPALVVVDLQRDFCTPGYRFERDRDLSHVQAAVESTGRFLDRYRASGRTPILIRTHHDEHTNGGFWAEKYEGRSPSCVPGTDGAAFVPELDVGETDVVVTKHRYNGFYNTALETHLEANDVSEVLVCGVSANVCVESTVRGAVDRGYDVTVLSDCTSAIDPERVEPAFENVEGHFGTVADSSSVELDARSASPED